MNKDDQAKLLIEIILDKNGDEAERSDALIYLQDHDYGSIGDALLELINDENENFDMRFDACETLASVWNNQNECDKRIISLTCPRMINILKKFTLALRPEWDNLFKDQ